MDDLTIAALAAAEATCCCYTSLRALHLSVTVTMGMSTTTPHEQVTRRMEALVDLLKAAAGETDDNILLSKESERIQRELSTDSVIDALPEEPQDWDEQVENLTKQLEECRKETPERIEIEEAQPARVTYKPASRTRRPSKQMKPTHPPPDTEDRRQQLQREFSEMSYPKIGPGYSDTISVVSDLSIPTVVTNLHVAEEEYYKDLPGMQIGIQRQPSIGSNMMTAPPEREDESILMAPSLVAPSVAAPSLAAPSVAAPSLVAPSVAAPSLRAPSQRVVAPIRRPGGAAAQRRQTHQAVLAHLQRAEMGPSSRRNFIHYRNAAASKPTLTVNDLPPLNFPNDEPSEYMRKPNGKRRSLLRKSNKYAASVTATSTRMLLSQKQKQLPTKRTPVLNRTKQREQSPQASTNSNVDLDGVLSTMNCDIDFIFQELSVLEDSTPAASPSRAAAAPIDHALDNSMDESNIGATAKIKYTLTSVARTLRHKEHSFNKDSLLKNEDNMSWGSLKDDKKSLNSSVAGDPLLIDEDGFIVTKDGDDSGFPDPFGPKEDLFAPMDGDPFSGPFFPAAKTDIAASRKKPKRSGASIGSVTEHAKQPEALSPLFSPDSTGSKESRIDAVEMATKKRIDMLRKLVEYRAKHVSEGSKRRDVDELEKLDFVEAETMKQIARLRDRLGASRRELGHA